MHMSNEMKSEWLPKVRIRYARRNGYDRKYAIKLLGEGVPEPSGRKHPGPEPQYGSIEPIGAQGHRAEIVFAFAAPVLAVGGGHLADHHACGVYRIRFYAAHRAVGPGFSTMRGPRPNCLDALNIHQVPTRCADNRMWAVCNNSSQPYSHWGSFIARPDATIPKRLEINQPGMLIHDFPDGLSEGGWYHNFKPMQKPACQAVRARLHPSTPKKYRPNPGDVLNCHLSLHPNPPTPKNPATAARPLQQTIDLSRTKPNKSAA
jgi:hypothetical protein